MCLQARKSIHQGYHTNKNDRSPDKRVIFKISVPNIYANGETFRSYALRVTNKFMNK